MNEPLGISFHGGDDKRNEIDCVPEAQLLPEQAAYFEVGEGQSLVVFTR